MSAQSKPRGHNPMTGEGAEVEFLGEGFPPASAVAIGVLLARLAILPIRRPTREKAERIEQISDVVVQSAYSIVEDEMLDDEAEFAQQAIAKPAINEQNAEVDAAMLNLARVFLEVQRAGYFIVPVVTPVRDSFDAE